MDKKNISATLEKIANFLELKGESGFRVRAFQNSARAINDYSGSIEEGLVSGALASVPGVGKGTLEIVSELVTTGHSRVLEELEKETPRGLLEMMKISGLGVAKIRLIHEHLGIENLDDLEKAAMDGSLAALPRFGAKTAANVLKGISYLRRSSEFRLFHHARAESDALCTALQAMTGVRRALATGAVRRRCDVISDLEFVVELEGNPDPVVAALSSIDGIIEFQPQSPRMVTLKFGSGTAAKVTLSGSDTFGSDLARTTGSETHNQQLVEYAKNCGFEWDDDALTKDGQIVPCPSEEVFFEIMGLQFIPAELREGTGEIDASSKHQLPKLLEQDDLKGFLHCHTNYSDGSSTVEEWAAAGRELGYEYLGITDHSQAATYAGGLSESDIARQHAEIDAVNRKFDDIRVLKGVEVDILADGSPDYQSEVRKRFDFVIASVHNRYGMASEEMTARILKTLDDPTVSILGHPTGRMLLSRDPYPMDLTAVLQKAAEAGVAVEINSDPQRLDLSWQNTKEALALDVTISIGADAHSTHGADNVELGVGVARKGWVEPDNVLNTRSESEFMKHAKRGG
jgi:DNA polymerase (family 10)